MEGVSGADEKEEQRVAGLERWVDALADDVGVVMRRRALAGYGLKNVSLASHSDTNCISDLASPQMGGRLTISSCTTSRSLSTSLARKSYMASGSF